MSELNDLYQQVIMDHNKNPRNFSVLDNATQKKEGFNPLCGDKVTIYITINDHHIENISFQGCGCAISIASASLMTEILKAKKLELFEPLFQDFNALVTKGNTKDTLGKLTVLRGVAEFPMRVKCATMAWHTLKSALEEAST